MTNNNQLEKRLWEAADQLRANSSLTAQKLQRSYNEAEEVFKLEMKRGEHLHVIKYKVEEIISTLDNSGYQDLQQELESTISYITKSRYEKIQMADNLPQGFFREDENLIPYELLSTGTKDVLGLALRLAMAKYFLQNAHTFL